MSRGASGLTKGAYSRAESPLLAPEARHFLIPFRAPREPLIRKHVCQKARVDKIEKVEGGYGKGYTFALDEWRLFLH